MVMGQDLPAASLRGNSEFPQRPFPTARARSSETLCLGELGFEIKRQGYLPRNLPSFLRTDVNGTGPSGGVVAGLSSRYSQCPFPPPRSGRRLSTCASASSVLIRGRDICRGICRHLEDHRRVREDSAIGPNELDYEDRPLALLGKTRCKSPISLGFKFHLRPATGGALTTTCSLGAPLWR